MNRLARLWHGAVELAGTRRGAYLLVAAALVVHALQSLGWPVTPGRDLGAYLLYYAEMWQWDAVFPWAMLSRTPGGPLVLGGVLDVGSGLVLEVVAALLFVGSVLAWALAARTFGKAPALVVGVALVLYPGYGVIFHEWTVDLPMAALFAGWSLLLVRTLVRPSWWRLALVGAGLAALVLTRPANQVLVLAALAPLAVAAPWRLRLARTAVVAVVAVGLLGGWAYLNGERYDDVTVARGGGAVMPLFRAFVTDRIVHPDNGPASRELAAVVERELLTLEPYRSYGIDLDEFFASGSARMQEDLVSLSDRVWGWDADYAVLADVGREAVRAHPEAFARGVLESYWELLSQPLFAGRGVTAPTGSAGGTAAQIPLPSSSPEGRPLPTPSEGEPIPSENQSSSLSTPDGSLREVWTSATDHHLELAHPADQVRIDAANRKIDELLAVFPHHWSSSWLGLQLDRSSKLYPPLWLLVLVGAVAVAIRRPARWPLLVLPALLALAVLLVTVLAVYGIPYYSVPFAPAFVLLAAGGLLGDRRARAA